MVTLCHKSSDLKYFLEELTGPVESQTKCHDLAHSWKINQRGSGLVNNLRPSVPLVNHAVQEGKPSLASEQNALPPGHKVVYFCIIMHKLILLCVFLVMAHAQLRLSSICRDNKQKGTANERNLALPLSTIICINLMSTMCSWEISFARKHIKVYDLHRPGLCAQGGWCAINAENM